MKNLLTRRDFLRTAGATIAVAAAGPQLFAADEKPSTPQAKRPIKKAIMWGTIGVKGSIAEKMKAVKAAGFDGVEMMSHMDADEVLRARDASGLEIPSVCGEKHWGKPLSSPDAAVRAEGLAGLKQTLRDAKRYGASSVLLVPAVVNQEISYAAAYTRSQAEIREAVPLAEELGVKIAIENVWNNFLLSPLEAVRYVDEFNSTAVGWHFDVGNVIATGWPEQWIQILGQRIQKVHIKEFSRKKMNEEGLRKGFAVEYLEGDNDWPAVMKAFDEIGYNGWCIVEPACGPCQEKLSPEEFLKKVSADLDEILAS